MKGKLARQARKFFMARSMRLGVRGESSDYVLTGTRAVNTRDGPKNPLVI